MKWTPRSIRALDMTLTKHMQAQGHNFSYPQNLSSRPDPYLSEPQSTFDPDFSQHNNSSLFLNGTQDFDKDFDSHHARGSALNDQQKRPEQSDYPWPRFPGELIRSDSEADSLIDLYRRPKSSTNMPPNMPPNIPSSSKAWKSVDPHTPSRDDSENSRWIHRDKLTMIEIQEYRDRGIEPPPELLRRAGISIEGGKDVKSNGQVERSKHSKKASLSSRPNSNGTNETIDEGFVPQDPRSPEEIATDPYDLSPGYHSSSLRSGSSRIPLSVSSPAPVPVEHLERSTPLPRKRGASGHWDEDALRYPKTRVEVKVLMMQRSMVTLLQSLGPYNHLQQKLDHQTSILHQPPKRHLSLRETCLLSSNESLQPLTAILLLKDQEHVLVQMDVQVLQSIVQKVIHHGYKICTNLILLFHRINKSYQLMPSVLCKNNGKRKGKLLLP